MVDSVKGGRIDTRKFKGTLLRRLRIGGVSKIVLDSSPAEERKERSPITRARRRGPGDGPSDAPFCIDVILLRPPNALRDRNYDSG